MTVRIADAIAAYSAATRGAVATPVDAGAPAAGESFASMVKQVATEAVEQNRHAEEMSKAAITGKADLRDVVVAVNSAEHALETVVAVRDKVITAYNDILRMPI